MPTQGGRTDADGRVQHGIGPLSQYGSKINVRHDFFGEGFGVPSVATGDGRWRAGRSCCCRGRRVDAYAVNAARNQQPCAERAQPRCARLRAVLACVPSHVLHAARTILLRHAGGRPRRGGTQRRNSNMAVSPGWFRHPGAPGQRSRRARTAPHCSWLLLTAPHCS